MEKILLQVLLAYIMFPESLFHFKDSVKIVNPDYVMTADTMDYNTNTETAFFTGPSEMKGDSIYLYCEKGWYDTKNDITNIWKNAVIDNKKQIIHGDSLFYDDNTGYGQSFGNVSIADTTNNLIVKGNMPGIIKNLKVSGYRQCNVYSDIRKGFTFSSCRYNKLQLQYQIHQLKAYRLMRAYLWMQDLQQRSAGKMRLPLLFIPGFSNKIVQILLYSGLKKISLPPIQWQYLQKTGRQTGWNYIIQLLLQARLILSDLTR